MKEAEVMKAVLRKLDNLELTGDVIWHSRLNSGKIFNGRSWIHLCKAGTPDIISVINCWNGKIVVLFIECKKTSVKRLSFEQKEFFRTMEGKPMIMCIMLNNPDQLWPAILKARAL